ncbi:MAG: hypothetical protein BMS9Abin29_0084 [Gemmatimonadota bacterium]|nr:MAG: hypothetical protein BMS9Abin29_0084 [Gemmatimonadota bacterium]
MSGGVLVTLTVATTVLAALRAREPFGAPATPSPLEWVGAIHVHTVHSDGGGTLDDVAAAAREADLDFVVVTDHNVWAAQRWTYREGALLIIGEEARVPGGHLLVIGGNDPSRRAAQWPERTRAGGARPDPAIAAGDVLRVVAHPRGPGRPWLFWDVRHFDALEIWNWDTDWRSDPLWDWMRALPLLPFEPTSALARLVDRPASSLARWDALLSEARIAGICSVDAHARVALTETRFLPFPAYRHLFRLVRQHVFLDRAPSGDPYHDGDLVIEALRRGRGYCGFDGIADARGLTVEVEAGGDSAGPGQRVVWAEGATLRVTLPAIGEPTTLTLLRDGVVIYETGEATIEVAVSGPGVYRIEVSVRPESLSRAFPWILANPVFVDAPKG